MIAQILGMLLLAHPATLTAQQPEKPATAKTAKPPMGWQIAEDRIGLPDADLSLPKIVGTAVFVSSGEFSHKGESLDNYVQYESPDERVFGTAYVYRPGYPDAALTAFETDAVVRDRFGPATKVTSQGVVGMTGHPGSVIRLVYTGGSDPKVNAGDPVTTAAAFLRASGWIVKLRATGPAARNAEVVAVLDAMIAGLRIGEKSTIYPAALLKIGTACPASAGDAAFIKPTKDGAARILGAAMASVPLDPKKGEAVKNSIRVSFPQNGLEQACVRGAFTLSGRPIMLLQPAGTATPQTVVGVINDAGAMLVIEKSLLGAGYEMKSAGIGQVDIFGSFDGVPSTAQLTALYAGTAREGGTRQAQVKITASGDSTINIDNSLLK